MEEWLNIPNESRNNIFKEIEDKSNLKSVAVEKDWWVVQTLRLIFDMEMAESLVFKAGTSLSKAWGMVQHLSEDIDTVILLKKH